MKHYFVTISINSRIHKEESYERYGSLDSYYSWRYGGDGEISCYGTDLQKLKLMIKEKLESRIKNAQNSLSEIDVNKKYKVLLQQDDCAPDSFVSFEKGLKKITGMPLEKFKSLSEIESTEMTVFWTRKNYRLSYSGDDPFYLLEEVE